MAGPAQAPTLYERIGGEAAVMAAVDIFYDKVLGDPLLAPYFEQLDMQAQARKQVAFMAWAFGGPERYAYRDLTEAHRGVVARGVGDAHFDAVAKHLRATLEELMVGESMIEEALTLVAATRKAVLGR